MNKTPYGICLAPRIVKELRLLTPARRKLVFRVAEALAINPRPPGATRIEGMSGLYSDAVEDLRLVYKIEDQNLILLFIR